MLVDLRRGDHPVGGGTGQQREVCQSRGALCDNSQTGCRMLCFKYCYVVQPGFVVKTALASDGMKVFLNICQASMRDAIAILMLAKRIELPLTAHAV
jgi:hypothetical protein